MNNAPNLPKSIVSRLPRKKLEHAGRSINGWIRLSEHIPHVRRGFDGGVSMFLLGQNGELPLKPWRGWFQHGLGEVESQWPYEQPDDLSLGMEKVTEDAALSFLCQGRNAPGSDIASIDINPEYLWFWDAYSVPKGWNFVSYSGEVHELIKWDVSGEGWSIDFRVEHLRTFLKATGKRAVVQVDLSEHSEGTEEPRAEHEYTDAGGAFTLIEYNYAPVVARDEPTRTVNLTGSYYVDGRWGDVVPVFLESSGSDDYPELIVSVNNEGELVKFTCDPEKLLNYFRSNAGAPHYLECVFFKPEVLDKYRAKPSTFRVSHLRLECLHFWGLDISINEQGLVVAYLGDIGKKLPASELRHWEFFNVPPEGTIDEGRFRRDFLNQPASSPDPVNDLRRAMKAVNSAAAEAFGIEIFRAPSGSLQTEVSALTGPTNRDPLSLQAPVLTLCKWIIDGIDNKEIKKYLENTNNNNLQSLQALAALLEDNSIDSKLLDPLRGLQRLRSAGGIAHRPNSDSKKTYEQMGIDGHDAIKDFKEIVARLNNALDDLSLGFGGTVNEN